jgi:hypothetical protein
LVESARPAVRVVCALLVYEVLHGLYEGQELLEEEFLHLHHEVLQGLLLLRVVISTRVEPTGTQLGAPTGQVVLQVQRVLVGTVVIVYL